MYGKFHMHISWPWWTTKGNFMSETWWYIMGLPPIRSEVLGITFPKLARRSWLCFAIGLNFSIVLLISSVWIITMIRHFSSSDYSAVGIDVFKIVVVSFTFMTRTMMFWGFWNSLRMYCFRFYMNFLYWPLASLFSDVVPKTEPKSYTSPLKFLIGDVYSGRLKLPPRPPYP